MSLITVLIVLATLWLIIEILSVVLKITGLDLYKARFQVISIITHTGFTTRESELITQHPLRRKIASILMVLSYVAQVTLISLFVRILTENEQRLVYSIAMILVIAIFIFIITRTRYMSSRFNRFVERVLSNRIMKQGQHAVDQILKTSPGYGVYELVLEESHPLCNKVLRDVHLNEMHIHVLKVDRGSKMYDFPVADMMLMAGDRLVLYGKSDSVKQLAFRQAA